VKELRKCWIVIHEGQLGGLIVRKDESEGNTDAKRPGKKILKICTFKVRAERRGIKLGELLLKQVLWFAQTNSYDLAYVTTFPEQATLIDLIEYYGFEHTYTKDNGELVYEKVLSRVPLAAAAANPSSMRHAKPIPISMPAKVSRPMASLSRNCFTKSSSRNWPTSDRQTCLTMAPPPARNRPAIPFARSIYAGLRHALRTPVRFCSSTRASRNDPHRKRSQPLASLKVLPSRLQPKSCGGWPAAAPSIAMCSCWPSTPRHSVP
jgi:hypothetical protein